MTDFEEKHFSIDPGIGEKMEGCPSSAYEDGHDVQDYIIAPKGYVFVGFKFEPLLKNQIYNGRLIAQYEKLPLKNRLTSNLWKVLLALAIAAVVGLIVLLSVSIFKSPKSTKPERVKPKTEVKAASKDTETATNDATAEAANTASKEVSLDQTGKTDNNAEPKPAETPAVQEAAPAAPAEAAQPAESEPDKAFKREFWDLIHSRTAQMDTYTDLFNNYKGKVSGEEFDYLRFTILKDYVSFKQWYDKLKRIPARQLENTNSVSDLINRIKEA